MNADVRGKEKIRVFRVYSCPKKSIKINIQIRAIKPVPAIGTGNLAILLAHLASAAVANENMLFVDSLNTFNP